MESKKCTKCGEVKELGEYYKQKTGKSGLLASCKTCSNVYQKIWKAKNLDKNKARKYHLQWSMSNKDKLIGYREKTKRNHGDKIKEKRLLREAGNRNELTDRYIKNLLWADGFTADVVDRKPELIELKRLTIKFKRL